MINSSGIVLVFLSIVILIIIEICSVARKINLEEVVDTNGLLCVVFGFTALKKTKVLGIFGFLHGANHIILTVGYSISLAMIFNNSFNSLMVILISIIVLLVWLMYPLLEAYETYNKMLKTNMKISSLKTHFYSVPIILFYIFTWVFLIYSHRFPNNILIDIIRSFVYTLVIFLPPYVYLKKLHKEVKEIKQTMKSCSI